jgi:cold shock CspA family protein
MTGTVDSFDAARGFGFLKTVDGRTFYIHLDDFGYARDIPEPGDRISFIPDGARGQLLPRARRAQFIQRDDQ